MKITLLAIGKTDADYLKEGIAQYESRIKHYLPFEIKIIADIKNRKTLSFDQQKDQEGGLILSQIGNSDILILLDEKGNTYTSTNFSKFIEAKMNSSCKHLVFAIGGPYGFSEQIYKRANGKISLSEMTFSHQMVRLIFTEQLYRAMTIFKKEPYHHEG